MKSIKTWQLMSNIHSEMEFKEFKPRFKSAKTRFKSWNIWYNFKWNQPYLNRGINLNRRSNSLNSATEYLFSYFNLQNLMENSSQKNIRNHQLRKLSKITTWRNCTRNVKWPSIQRWQWLIHNGTHESWNRYLINVNLWKITSFT